jgi:monoamine oxidase
VKAIVVGAGLAGLAAADALSHAGVEVQVFEARDRVGGRVWSAAFAGVVVERGAEFVLPENSTFKGMAARFGLQLVRKGMHYGAREPYYGAREPRGPKPVSLEDVKSAVVRLANLSPGAGESVQELLERAGLDEHVEAAIRARIEVSCGHPASDLETSVVLEAGTAFGEFDTHTVDGGNSRLAEALAETIGRDRIVLSAPVTRVRHTAEKVVVTAGGAPASADLAVLAVPASVIGGIVFDPALPEGKVRAHAAVRYGQAAKLFIAMRSAAPPSATMAVGERFWCYTQLDRAGRPLPVMGAFAGTPEALAALQLSEGPARWSAAAAALRPDLELDLTSTLLCTWADDPWVRGAYSARSVSSPIDDAELARPLGNLAFAGEHTAGPEHGMMDGALRSGIRAANDLLTTSALR